MTTTRLLTSFRMQAQEYRQRLLLLVIVLVMPVLLFAASYYSGPPGDPTPIEVPQRGGSVTLYVDARETWPMTIGIMGVVWGVATIAFFGVVGNLERDRRLLLSGYRVWEIVLARAALLGALSVPLALAGSLPYLVVTASRFPLLVWLACFLAALMAAGFGLLVGILLPRPTEGLLVIIIGTGIGLSLAGDAARYFFLYPAMQLLTMGRLAQEPWPYPYIAGSLLISTAFLALSLALWWRRTRLPRHTQLRRADGWSVDELTA